MREPELHVIEHVPVLEKGSCRIDLAPEVFRQRQVHHRTKNQAGIFNHGSELLDVVQAVLFWTGEVLLQAGVRKMRSCLRIEWFVAIRSSHHAAPLPFRR